MASKQQHPTKHKCPECGAQCNCAGDSETCSHCLENILPANENEGYMDNIGTDDPAREDDFPDQLDERNFI